MKTSTLISMTLFILGVLIFLIQLWFESWSSEMFSKIMITDIVLFGVSLVVVFLIKENKESQDLHKGDRLD
jgi:uncharacterized membrane protein YiaA